MLIAGLFLMFCTVGLIGYALIPPVYSKASVLSEKRKHKLSTRMEQHVSRQKAKEVSRLLFLAPVVISAVLFFVVPSEFQIIAVVTGLVLGFILPSFYIHIVGGMVKEKFNLQLVDALMIMSSSFRGGLSLVQAMEAVVEEMPDPVNREFGIVLGENKMGVSLDDAMNHMYNRMPSPALQQVITSILLARETGGNLPVIFNRIVTNIRESNKVRQNLKTLTVQGKIQGIVLSILPIGFAWVVFNTNRHMFDHMFASELGRTLLVTAAFLEVIGVFLIWRISTFKDF